MKNHNTDSIPCVSIVTVVYNSCDVIEKTILSVIEQSASHQIEYIIVDGGSTDGTMDIILQYKDQIDILISEKDRGIYDAMNKGIQIASGDWICFMNAGDTFYDTDTIKTLSLDKTPNDRIVYGDCVLVTSKGNFVKKAHPFFNEKSIIKGIGICHQSIYAPTAILKKRPFQWKKFPHCADYDFLYYLHTQGFKFDYRPYPLCYYQYGEGFSSNPKDYQSILKENATILGKRYSWAFYKEIIRHWLK